MVIAYILLEYTSVPILENFTLAPGTKEEQRDFTRYGCITGLEHQHHLLLSSEDCFFICISCRNRASLSQWFPCKIASSPLLIILSSMFKFSWTWTWYCQMLSSVLANFSLLIFSMALGFDEQLFPCIITLMASIFAKVVKTLCISSTYKEGLMVRSARLGRMPSASPWNIQSSLEKEEGCGLVSKNGAIPAICMMDTAQPSQHQTTSRPVLLALSPLHCFGLMKDFQKMGWTHVLHIQTHSQAVCAASLWLQGGIRCRSRGCIAPTLHKQGQHLLMRANRTEWKYGLSYQWLRELRLEDIKTLFKLRAVPINGALRR